MAMPIRDVTKLIPGYDGKEKMLDSFIKKIDRLWTHIAELEEAEKAQFLLVLHIKLTNKAAEAVQNNTFEDWETVRTALIEKITPHRNTEKSELKLCAIRQNQKENIEVYAKRIEKALDTLNRSFAQEDQNEVIRRENDRRARKTFENGLRDPMLRDKAISRGNSTLKEAIDYIIEQELRYSELEPVSNAAFGAHCEQSKHESSEDAPRKLYVESRGTSHEENHNEAEFTPRKSKLTCYRCNKLGHYANACTAPAPPTYQVDHETTRQLHPPPLTHRNYDEIEISTTHFEYENSHSKN